MTSQSTILAAKTCDLIRDIVTVNAEVLTEKLLASETGKLSVSVPVKFQLVKGRLYVGVKLSVATKFDDEAEDNFPFSDPDPAQGKMEGVMENLDR